MKSLNEWRLAENYNPEWENLKFVWGNKTQNVNTSLVNALKVKIGKIQDDYIKSLDNPQIQDLRDLPPDQRDQLAQSLVVAVLKAFYQNLEPTISGGKSTFNANKLGNALKNMPQINPGDEMNAPKNWSGK